MTVYLQVVHSTKRVRSSNIFYFVECDCARVTSAWILQTHVLACMICMCVCMESVFIDIQKSTAFIYFQKETRRCYGVLCENLDFMGWKIERG